MTLYGSAKKFTPHKGSWGDKYIIEKNKEPRCKVSCSDCKYYCNDGSCTEEPVVIAEVGYDNWKGCKSFVLTSEVTNFDEKKEQVRKKRGIYYVEKQRTNDFEQKASCEGNGGIDYWSIDNNIKNYFYSRYVNKNIGLGDITYDLIPKELYIGFNTFIEKGNSKLYEDALAVMIRNFGLEPNLRGIIKLKRKSLKYIIELLFTGKYVGNNIRTFDKLICDFLADFFHDKKIY